LEDVIAAYDYIANIEGVDKENIRVVGESFGGYLACLLSTKRPVKKMALRVPTDFPNIGFTDVPQIRITGNLSNEWKSQKHAFTESYALSAINAFTGNLMMIASEKDNFVPFQTTENYLAAVNDSSKLEYLFMKRASHGMFHPKLQWDYNRILSKWLRI
jgi:esterase/lipase